MASASAASVSTSSASVSTASNKPRSGLPTNEEAKAARVKTWDFVSATYARENGPDAKFEIKESVLPGAGLGVFATRAIDRSMELGFYRGKYLTQEEFDAKYPTGDAEYVFSYRNERESRDKRIAHVDGIDPFPHTGPASRIQEFNWPRYINHGPKELVNCEWKDDGTNYGIIVVPTKQIRAGDELFVDYGADYWNEDLFVSETGAPMNAARKEVNEKRKRTEERTAELYSFMSLWPNIIDPDVAHWILQIVLSYKEHQHDKVPWPPNEEISRSLEALFQMLRIREPWEQRVFIQMLRQKVSTFKRTTRWKTQLINAAARSTYAKR